MVLTCSFKNNFVSDSKFTSIKNNRFVVDYAGLDKKANDLFEKVLPVIAGLANSTAEMDKLNNDQYYLMLQLSKKVIDYKNDGLAYSIAKMIFGEEKPSTNPLDILKGGK